MRASDEAQESHASPDRSQPLKQKERRKDNEEEGQVNFRSKFAATAREDFEAKLIAQTEVVLKTEAFSVAITGSCDPRNPRLS